MTPARTVIIALILCAIAAAPARPQSAKSSLTDPKQAAEFNRISDRLVCQCGCGMILRVCNHFECPSAIPMRAKIDEQIVAGMSEDEIVDGFVAEYGKVVLSSPPPEGVDLAAWVMPGFAVLIGLFIVTYFVADMLSKRRIKPATSHGPADPETVARIERELRSMDD
jgi:cytochrome c-type biogenesis protein CcmH/NrfF